MGLLYGASHPIAKIALSGHINPFGFVLIRITSAAIIFWFISIWIKDPIQSKRDFMKLALCAVFGVAANQMLFLKGLSMSSPITTSIIMTSIPIIVVIAAYFILNERLTKMRALGISIGAAGAILLIITGENEQGTNTILGNILLLLNASSYAVFLVIVKPLLAKYNSLTIVKWIFTFAFFYVLPFGLFDVIAVDWQNFAPEAWGSLLYVVFGITVLAYLLNAWSLNFVSPTVVGYYAYTQPVFTTLTAAALAQDHLQLNQIVFSLLIFFGVYLVGKK